MIAEMPSTSTAMGQLLGEGIGDSELHVSSSKVIDNLHVNATAPRLGEWFLPDCEPFVNEIVCEFNVSPRPRAHRSEERTSELQSRQYLVCRLLLEKKKYIPANALNQM